MSKNFMRLIRSIGSDTSVSFTNKELIVSTAKEPHKSYYITSGYVKVYDLSVEGNVKIISILKAGDMFPLIWGFDHPPETVYYYQAMGEVELLTCETAILRAELESSVEIARQAQLAFVYLSWDLMERVKALQMPYTQEKIVRLLPYLAAKIGEKVGEKKYKLRYAITQEEISQFIGSTRESVSKHLAIIEQNNIISRADSYMIIDLEAVPQEYVYDVWFKEHLDI